MKPTLSMIGALIGGSSLIGVAAAQQAAPSYTAVQAERGAALFQEKCTTCHGADLGAGQFAPSLKGTRFKHDWSGKPAAALFAYMAQNMPPGDAASVPPEQHADMLAFILQGNGIPPGAKELPASPDAITGVLPQ